MRLKTLFAAILVVSFVQLHAQKIVRPNTTANVNPYPKTIDRPN